MDVLRHKMQAECAGDVGDEEDEHEEAALILEFVVQVDAKKDGANDEGAVWDLHQSRDECREAKSLDDEGSKV